MRPESPACLSLAAPVSGFIHRRSLRARPPFTRPCRSFFCAYAELIRGQMPPTDFCNCFYDVRATKPLPAPSSSQGRRPRSPSFSLRTTPPIAGQWHAASRAPSVFDDPGASSSRLPEFAWPRYLRNRPTTAGFPRSVHSEDQRARVEGPSEGRVPDTHATVSRACVRCPRISRVSRRRSPPRRPSDIRCHRRVRPPRRKPR
jgi:hypothetical protein